MGLKNINRKSLRYKWTKSFLVILLIPIIVNYGFYLFFMNSIRGEVNQKNQVFYNNVIKEMDISIQKFKKISADLGINRNVQNISNTQDASAVDSAMSDEFEESINRYYIDLYSAYRVFVYFSANEMVGTLEGIDTAENYLSNQLGSMEMDQEEWRQWLNETGNESRCLLGMRNINGVQPKYIAVKYTIFENRQAKPTNMVILLRDSSLRNIIDTVLEPGTVFVDVLNEQGELIATTFDTEFDRGALYERIAEDTGAFREKIDGQSSYVSYATSGENRWKYIFYTREELYYSEIRKLNVIFGCSMIFVIIAGLILIREIVGKQYSPVAKILSKMPKPELPDTPKEEHSGDEYLEIENMVLDSIKSKRENMLISKKQEKSRTDNFVRNLLNGIIRDEEAAGNWEMKLPFHLNEDKNCVALFVLTNYTDLFREEKMTDFERYGMLIDIIDNIGSEILQGIKCRSYFAESSGTLVCLINSGEEIERILSGLEEILENVEKYFSLKLIVCVGRAYNGIDGLRESYREALYCLDYIDAGEQSVFYGDIEKESERAPIFNIEEENILNNYIRSGKKEEACAYIKNLFDLNFEQLKRSSSGFKYYVNEIITDLLRNFSQYIDTDDAYVNNIYLLLVMQSVEYGNVEQNVEQLVGRICEKIAVEISGGNDKSVSRELVGKICAFVEENYANPELSCEMVADYCGMSAAYVSRTFRNEKQEGLSNYISKMRIERAKMLLTQNKQARIEDIAQSVGVLNVNTFIRMFKKFEGITPGTFKKL